MLLALYAVCALTITGLVMLVHAAFTAPQGVEDSNGFHFTDPAESQAALPVTMLHASDLPFFTR